MSEKFSYLSPAWGQEVERRLREEIDPEKMNHP